MGINLALQILEGTSDDRTHGGPEEAVSELIRESFWMTKAELARARRWASRDASNDARLLVYAVDSELRTRKTNALVGYRAN